MEIDNTETEFAIVRQGYYQDNLIFKLNQRNLIGVNLFFLEHPMNLIFLQKFVFNS